MQAKPERYIKIRLLGEGSFGKAYLVRAETANELCVIKEIDIASMTAEEQKETLKEAKILESLSHPNIVRFREVYKTKKGNLCIVMDYADGGDLLQKIKNTHGKYLPEKMILDWFTQIALAIKHIHDRKIIHRDLKSQNIFLTSKNFVQLGDFGIAKVLSHTMDKANTVVGTPYYLSPEIIEGKPYSFSSDIWSLGVILYEMCTLKPPFNASSLQALGMKIIKGVYPSIPAHYSTELKKLIAQCLTVDSTKRPSINKILSISLYIDYCFHRK